MARDSINSISLQSTVTNRSTKFAKLGNIVVAFLELSVTAEISGTWVTIATIPEGFRPAASGRIVWLHGETGGTLPGSVESNGSVKINGTAVANAVICANFCYTTA